MSWELAVAQTGVLLIAGGLLFLIGAARWKPKEYQQSLPEAMRHMDVDAQRVRAIFTWMSVGVCVTTGGIAALVSLEIGTDGSPIAFVALSLFVVGAAAILANLLFGLTVLPWGAQTLTRTGSLPEGFEALKGWADLSIGLHMILSYAAIALLGWSLLASDIVAPWLGWAGIVFGVVWCLGFVRLRSALFAPPILVHVWPFAVGVALIVRTITD